MIYALRFRYVRRNESRMKKSKLTLGLVTGLVSIGALAACNEVTYSDGVVLEYTDAQGNKTKITAMDLFSREYSSGTASTDFESVYEVLIRKYYESGSGQASLATLKGKAEKDVQDVKDQASKNAESNGTSYDEELEKLLSSNNVETVAELFDAKLYEEEKKKFEQDYETNDRIEEMRDGKGIFSSSEDYGVGSDGYLVEQMPYTISHILVKFASATNGEHTQATISEAESRKLGQLIELLAGADINNGDGKIASARRTEFGTIAKTLPSDDSGSAEKYGQLDVMDRDLADSFINEFKFGIYSYEAIYNAVNQDEALNPYAAKETLHENSGKTYKLTDKIRFSSDATYTDMSLPQTAEEEANLGEGEHYIQNFFYEKDATGELVLNGGKPVLEGIGRIPYGAAVALAKDSVAKNEFTYMDGLTEKKMNWEVNGNSSSFYPRNILFNKYFNNHRVAVIVPNEIAYNDPSIALITGGDYSTENFEGAHDDDYAALPGFAKDSSDVLPDLGCNALTTEKGQIILAVRGGSSGSYEGIHFMVIDRSALHQYAEGNKMISAEDYEARKGDDDVNSLSEFYTIYKPGETNFPTYKLAGIDTNKTTYVNQLHTTPTNYTTNVKTLKDKIKGYNGNKDTYMFQKLVTDSTITFGTHEVAKNAEKLIKAWIKTKREKSVIDTAESFDKAWATYIEYLTSADEARALNPDGSQRLISETCAIGYNKRSSDKNSGEYAGSIWANGGACYAK